MRALVDLEAEWAPKWLQYDQKMMDIHSRKRLVDLALQDVATALHNATTRAEDARNEVNTFPIHLFLLIKIDGSSAQSLA